MFKEKIDRWIILIIIIISILLVFDLFVNKGQSQNMDGNVHIATIAHFYKAIKDGDLKATWADGFANYGMPIPLIAHQIPMYLGAYINFFFHNVIVSFNVVYLIATLFSAIFFYMFLRIYFKPIYALAGLFFFHFAPYRIINLYIRGALPEYMASVFLPLVLIAIYYFIQKKKI